MTLMEKEILSQPEAVRHAAEANADCIRAFVTAAKARGVSQIVTAARGSSDNACTYFKYLCEIYAGIPVSSAAPGVMTLYGGRPDMSHAAVIGVSQSGAAADVIAVIETARAQGAVTAAITSPARTLCRTRSYRCAPKFCPAKVVTESPMALTVIQ